MCPITFFHIYWIAIIFSISCFIFVSNQKHLLATLLTLEFIVLILFIALLKIVNLRIEEAWVIMIFIVFSVCEGALGLSILVSIIRTHGNNYFQSFNLLIC